MAILGAPVPSGESRVVSGPIVTRRASRRDEFEALGFLLGLLGTLLVVAIAVGGSGPIGS